MAVDIVDAALMLRRAAGKDVFDLFVRKFGEYTNEAVYAVTDAGPEQVLEAQGRARQCRALHRAFVECHLRERPKQ